MEHSLFYSWSAPAAVSTPPGHIERHASTRVCVQSKYAKDEYVTFDDLAGLDGTGQEHRSVMSERVKTSTARAHGSTEWANR